MIVLQVSRFWYSAMNSQRCGHLRIYMLRLIAKPITCLVQILALVLSLSYTSLQTAQKRPLYSRCSHILGAPNPDISHASSRPLSCRTHAQALLTKCEHPTHSSGRYLARKDCTHCHTLVILHQSRMTHPKCMMGRCRKGHAQGKGNCTGSY